MTDSEDDVSPNNVYSFPVDRMAIRAKGPNYSNRTFSGRNYILTSTLHPSRNIERRNFNYDQRSLYYKRDPSPMSLRRVSDFRLRNFYLPFSVGGAGYGRSGLLTSGQSIDTNISISATDIALAIKTEAYDKHGLNLIKEALNKQFKKKLRNRVEKRRNQRFLLHMSKRKSGDDSDEQGSDSSISSDECRSVANNSKYKKRYLPYFKMKVDEDNLYKDCTKEIQRKSLKNICSDALPAKIPTQIEAKEPIHSNSEKSVLLKDRFQIGFSLPLERLNETSKNSSHPSRHIDNNVRPAQIINGKQQMNNKKIPENNVNEDFESQEEEVFSEITAIENNCNIDDISHKKTIDLDELHCNPPKKSKVIVTQSQKGPHGRNCIQNNVDSEFIFANPQMPVRKSGNSKQKLHSHEKLISMSRQHLFDNVEHTRIALSPIKELPIQNHSKRAVDIGNKEWDKPAPLKGDLSMQPSFIKRKAFTQKLDVAEKKNMSDSFLSSGPQAKNVCGNKEKNKARKLASSQSCLSQDVLEEDNNFLDLINKIVPVDQINITNADEEIIKIDNHCNNKAKIQTITKSLSESITNCKIVLDKLPVGELNKTASNIAHKPTFINKAKEQHKESPKLSELENHDLSRNVNDSKNSNKADKSMNKIEHLKKQQDQKAVCMSVEVKKAMGTKSKSKKGTNVKNAALAETKTATKNDNWKTSPESKESNNYLINKSSSDRNMENINNPTETSKTVKLLSHRMGRPKRQVKPKKIFTFDSPLKDSDNSIKETEKPTETSQLTTLTSPKSSQRSKGMNKTEHCQKQQDEKAACMPVEDNKAMGAKSKSKKGKNAKHAALAETKIATKNDDRKTSPESKESNNNLLNKISLDMNMENIDIPTETSKTVTLLSHRMGRPKRQVKPKKIFTIDSPLKESDNSFIKTEKPTDTSKLTTLTSHKSSQRIYFFHGHVKSNTKDPVESPLSKRTDNSTSDLNITTKSLRSYSKKKK